jgi:hypothetical protein
MSAEAQLTGLPLAGEPTPRAALLWLMAAAALTGAAMAASHGAPGPLMSLAGNLMLGFLPFLWYCRDGNQRGFRRTIWWNVAMVTFLFPAVFVYLWRTRAPGERGRAMLAALGCCLLTLLAALTGIALTALLLHILH